MWAAVPSADGSPLGLKDTEQIARHARIAGALNEQDPTIRDAAHVPIEE
jgi:hypothetical protein